MKIFKDTQSFDEPVWICIHGEYIYASESIYGLIDILNTEWEHDKHIAG
jgi:hypothetical protein